MLFFSGSPFIETRSSLSFSSDSQTFCQPYPIPSPSSHSLPSLIQSSLQSQLSALRSNHTVLSQSHNELQTTHSNLNLSTRTEIHSLTSKLTLSENKSKGLEIETQSLKEQLEKERILRKKVEEEKEQESEKNRKEILLLRDGGAEGRKWGEELSSEYEDRV